MATIEELLAQGGRYFDEDHHGSPILRPVYDRLGASPKKFEEAAEYCGYVSFPVREEFAQLDMLGMLDATGAGDENMFQKPEDRLMFFISSSGHIVARYYIGASSVARNENLGHRLSDWIPRILSAETGRSYRRISGHLNVRSPQIKFDRRGFLEIPSRGYSRPTHQRVSMIARDHYLLEGFVLLLEMCDGLADAESPYWLSIPEEDRVNFCWDNGPGYNSPVKIWLLDAEPQHRPGHDWALYNCKLATLLTPETVLTHPRAIEFAELNSRFGLKRKGALLRPLPPNSAYTPHPRWKRVYERWRGLQAAASNSDNRYIEPLPFGPCSGTQLRQQYNAAFDREPPSRFR